MAAQNVQHAKRSQDAAGPKDAASAGRWKGGGKSQRISEYTPAMWQAWEWQREEGKRGGNARKAF